MNKIQKKLSHQKSVARKSLKNRKRRKTNIRVANIQNTKERQLANGTRRLKKINVENMWTT